MKSSYELLESAKRDELRAWQSDSPKLAEYLESRARWKRFLARERQMDENLTREMEVVK